jgi:hypothetical protein
VVCLPFSLINDDWVAYNRINCMYSMFLSWVMFSVFFLNW